jgi:hypothetical protein
MGIIGVVMIGIEDEGRPEIGDGAGMDRRQVRTGLDGRRGFGMGMDMMTGRRGGVGMLALLQVRRLALAELISTTGKESEKGIVTMMATDTETTIAIETGTMTEATFETVTVIAAREIATAPHRHMNASAPSGSLKNAANPFHRLLPCRQARRPVPQVRRAVIGTATAATATQTVTGAGATLLQKQA